MIYRYALSYWEGWKKSLFRKSLILRGVRQGVGNTRNSTAEVDFVWKHQSKLLSVEVKSGRNVHLRS